LPKVPKVSKYPWLRVWAFPLETVEPEFLKALFVYFALKNSDFAKALETKMGALPDGMREGIFA
jgi:hypothetical protein